MNHMSFEQDFTGSIIENEIFQIMIPDSFFTFQRANKISPSRILDNTRIVKT